ncbi:MAG TPA: tyrosine-type recombinase/integrase [Gemmataceae bacterium]|nr:tyrosine-type recombinase/integrase [Gemmataceae bacterium]
MTKTVAKKLTVAGIGKYVPGKERREIRDTTNGLYLVIQPSGAKSWCMRFRRPNGRPAKLTLGPVDLSERETEDEPVFGGPLTIGQARELATRIDRERARGEDVIEKYKTEKLRKLSAAEQRAASSFGAAVVEFFRDHRTKRQERPRRWRGDARVLGLRWAADADPATTEPEVIPGGLAANWADKPVAEIDGHNIYTAVDDARRMGIPGLQRKNKGVSEARGRKVHAALSVMFAWLQKHRRISVNPTVGVWHPGAPPARERVLNDAEIKLFWAAAGKLHPAYAAAARLLLLTGARLNEVSGMRCEEFDGTIWTIPPERVKNHRRHPLPLPPLARELISEMPVTAGGFVFSTNGRTPLNGWSVAKEKFDEAIAATKVELGSAVEVKPWRLHDLRRSCATGMADLGIQPHIIEAVLNHVSGAKGGIAGVYNRAQYAAEVKVALERWSSHIEGLVAGRSAAVVSIGKRQ